MSLQILFFGELADAARACYGTEKLNIDYSESLSSLDKLEAALSREHKALEDLIGRKEHLRAVNQKMTRDNEPLSDGDEIALMSPFSGG